jgi:hypothetical protein
MSRQAYIQTTLARTSQLRRDASLLHALATSVLQPRISPSTPSPQNGFFAWRRAKKCGGTFGCGSPLACFNAGPNGQRAQRYRCCLDATASLYRRPSAGCFHRAPSLPYFPCLPSVTRLGASPAPCGTALLAFSAFRKSFRQISATSAERKDFPNLPKMRRLALGAGHLASLRARVSRGQSGQIQTGEKRWNSIPTT